jgi:hypothetical protein
MAICLVAGLRDLRHGERHGGLLAIAFALPPLGAIAFVENQWAPPNRTDESTPTLRLVHWNVAHGAWGIAGVERTLLQSRTDLVVLSEAPQSLSMAGFLARLGPEYRSVQFGTMAVIASGELDEPRRLCADPELKATLVSWRQPHGVLKILAIDIGSNILVARDPVLKRVVSMMAAHQPDLVVGDFNSPRRSRALWPPPRGYVHAYDVAGRGWSATWPVPCPLLAIDQCLLSRRVRARRFELNATWYSDHCLQSLEFSVGASE